MAENKCEDCIHVDVCTVVKPDLPVCDSYKGKNDFAQVLNGKWIPVSERLPDCSGRYLVCETEFRYIVYECDFYENRKSFGREMILYEPFSMECTGREFEKNDRITHWMKYPSPPENVTIRDKFMPEEVQKEYRDR